MVLDINYQINDYKIKVHARTLNFKIQLVTEVARIELKPSHLVEKAIHDIIS